MVVVVPVDCVAVRPQRSQHGEALRRCGLTFGVSQHLLVQCVRVATLEVQSECDVAVRVDLNKIALVR